VECILSNDDEYAVIHPTTGDIPTKNSNRHEEFGNDEKDDPDGKNGAEVFIECENEKRGSREDFDGASSFTFSHGRFQNVWVYS
jgi:hypothetical protein